MDDLQWIPEEFWDPVRVTVPEEVFMYESIPGGWDCLVCGSHRMDRTKLKCCRQHICKLCVKEWFTKKSTKCPYCKRDVREGKVPSK